MFQAIEPALLEDVIEQAITDAMKNCRTRRLADRWTQRIIRAGKYLRGQSTAGLDYNRETHTLTFTHPVGDVFTVTVNSCECEAYNHGRQPCEHRALARLIRRYLERYERGDVVRYITLKQIGDLRQMIECADEACGWRGKESELAYKYGRYENPIAICPKCDGEDLDAVAETTRSAQSVLDAIKSAFPSAFVKKGVAA